MQEEIFEIRSVLAEAERIHQLTLGGDRLPGPRLSQVQFGRMLVRSDRETALAIARDTAAHQGRADPTDADNIQSGWGGAQTAHRERVLPEELIENCGKIVRAAGRGLPGQRGFSADEERLLRYGALLHGGRYGPSAGWKSVLVRGHFPGRDERSLNADFAQLALRLYRSNRSLFDETEAMMREHPLPAHLRRSPSRASRGLEETIKRRLERTLGVAYSTQELETGT